MNTNANPKILGNHAFESWSAVVCPCSSKLPMVRCLIRQSGQLWSTRIVYFVLGVAQQLSLDPIAVNSIYNLDF